MSLVSVTEACRHIVIYTAEKNKISKPTRDALETLLVERVELARKEESTDLLDIGMWSIFRAKQRNHEDIMRAIGFRK
jgi:hypothetical protein